MIWALLGLTAFCAVDDKLIKANKKIQETVQQFDELLFTCHGQRRTKKAVLDEAVEDVVKSDVVVGQLASANLKSIGRHSQLTSTLSSNEFQKIKNALSCKKIKKVQRNELKALEDSLDLAATVRALTECQPNTKAFIKCDEKLQSQLKKPVHPSVVLQQKRVLKVIGAPRKCIIGSYVGCGELTDAISHLHGSSRDSMEIVRANIKEHVDFCLKFAKGMKEENAYSRKSIHDMKKEIKINTKLDKRARKQQEILNDKKDVATQQHQNIVDSCKDQLAHLSEQIESLKRDRAKAVPDELPFDCTLTDWAPRGACSKQCGGGSLKYVRHIIQAPKNGALCNALERQESCAEEACPQDCTLTQWSKWNQCTATCGGGMSQRFRFVEEQRQNAGAPCGILKEMRPCGTSGCDMECVIGEWDNWGSCTRVCGDGGKRQRKRLIVTPAVGQGLCKVPSEWGNKCETKSCPTLRGRICQGPVQVVVVTDASGSVSDVEFSKQMHVVKEFRELFPPSSVAVVRFSDAADLLLSFEEPDAAPLLQAYRLKQGSRLSHGFALARRLLARRMVPVVVVYVIEAKGPYSILTTKKEYAKLQAMKSKVVGVVVGDREAPWSKEIATIPSSENIIQTSTWNDLNAWDIFLRVCPAI